MRASFREPALDEIVHPDELRRLDADVLVTQILHLCLPLGKGAHRLRNTVAKIVQPPEMQLDQSPGTAIPEVFTYGLGLLQDRFQLVKALAQA